MNKKTSLLYVLKKYKTNHKHMNMSADIRYVFDGIFFESPNRTSSQYYSFFNMVRLDVDKLFDDIENKTFKNNHHFYENKLIETIELLFLDWVELLASDLEKSEIFYRFLYSLEIEIDSWKNKVIEKLIDHKISKLDKRLKYSTLSSSLNKQFNDKNQLLITNEESNFLDDNDKFKIDDIFNFPNTIIENYYFLLKNTSNTLDEVMYNIVNNDKIETKSLLNNIQSNLESPSINFNDFDFENISTINKTSKKEFKSIKRMLNKSINTIKTFLPNNDINAFIKGNEFTIEGKLFNYKIKKKKNYSLLQKKDNLSSYHIPYNLKLLSKNNNFIADMCITFDGCPILDQILSLYMMIKSNKEEEVIKGSNLSNRSDEYYSNKQLINILKKVEKTNEINLSNTINDVERNSNDNKIIYNSLKKEFTKILDNKVFKKYLKPQLFDTIFRNELSFDELSDYYSIRRLEGTPNSIFNDGEGQFSDTRLDFLLETNNKTICK